MEGSLISVPTPIGPSNPSSLPPSAVEDEVHALFGCTAEDRLLQIRSRFLDMLSSCDPTVRALHKRVSNYDFLLRLVSPRKAVQAFAKYVFDVLNFFQEFPRYFPVVFRNTVV
jgi:hypothetical protein